MKGRHIREVIEHFEDLEQQRAEKRESAMRRWARADEVRKIWEGLAMDSREFVEFVKPHQIDLAWIEHRGY